jgi:beta-phosphoglucomutase-like phosphatase (HAD superfamily)
MITAFDVTGGKPDPAPYLKAWEHSGVAKEQWVVIENAPLGVRSGKAAGLTVYAVNTGILTKEDFAQADKVFDNMAELLAFLQASSKH